MNSNTNIKILMDLMKKIPIGHYYDDDLVEPGRYFDRLVIGRKSGIFIYDDTTPKVDK